MNSRYSILEHPFESYFRRNCVKFWGTKNRLMLSTKARGKHGQFRIEIPFDPNTGCLAVVVALGLTVPAGQLGAAAELANRLNSSLRTGNFEVPPKSGVVLFRVNTFLPVGDPLPDVAVARLLVAAIESADTSYTAFVDVVCQGFYPKSAMAIDDQSSAN